MQKQMQLLQAGSIEVDCSTPRANFHVFDMLISNKFDLCNKAYHSKELHRPINCRAIKMNRELESTWSNEFFEFSISNASVICSSSKKERTTNVFQRSKNSTVESSFFINSEIILSGESGSYCIREAAEEEYFTDLAIFEGDNFNLKIVKIRMANFKDEATIIVLGGSGKNIWLKVEKKQGAVYELISVVYPCLEYTPDALKNNEWIKFSGNDLDSGLFAMILNGFPSLEKAVKKQSSSKWFGFFKSQDNKVDRNEVRDELINALKEKISI